MIISNNTISTSLLNGTDGKIETPNVKKRHRRMKSSGMKNTECDGRLQFLPLFYALSIKCQFGILIVNLLFHDFNTNFRYLFS